ncbi:hypothetical protein P170DRAFT_244236 [Aspergillus steynii IBT 23096]|uniref:Tautomerase cis-CaaD-like domain-containing protein n=1 Tax=Aspergillus steynii IBT 23096 TaxID=1392250 RepID=A0A2I2FXT5_9EURO|nr:uncharacterized protein P170DRAFT_244236 [Aspergillus steynii IBT 23096]PLB45449.1 hypothetical protein P170DRAFT_244236 [Aspergillus steynii IBT 23096]
MPLYTIEHAIPLDKSQRDALAQTLTHIHTRKFTTPSLFVNVQFVDSTRQCNYIAGKERRINRILAHVRAGGTRTTADFQDLAQKIEDAWNGIVNGGQRGSKETELNRVFVLGAITAGLENGILLPTVCLPLFCPYLSLCFTWG